MPALSTLVPSTLAPHERRFQAVIVGGLVTVFAIIALAPHTERALFEEGRLPSAFAAVVTDPTAALPRRFGTMAPGAFARAFRIGRTESVPVATRTMMSGVIPFVVTDQPPAFLAPVDDVATLLSADAGAPGAQGDGGGFLPASFSPGGGSGGVGTGIGAFDPAGPDPGGIGASDPAAPGPSGIGVPDPAGPGPSGIDASDPAGPGPGGIDASDPAGPGPGGIGAPDSADPGPSGISASDPTGSGPTGMGPADTGSPAAAVAPVSPIPEPASWMMIVSGMALVGFFARRAGKKAVAIA
jgi:hypothetical protein